MTPVIKNIIAKKIGTINTKLESKHLNLGEVALMRFASEREFRTMLQLGHFVEHVGPPPVVIQGNQSTPDVNPQDITPKTTTLAPPEVLAPVESRPCEQCRTMLILTTDTEGKQILFCANCNTEKPVQEVQEKSVQEVQEDETPKLKTVRSKCDCGKVKAKDAELCKSCTTELAQESSE